MVASTHEQQVVEARDAPVAPVVHMMGVAPPRRAAREATAAVARSERTAD